MGINGRVVNNVNGWGEVVGRGSVEKVKGLGDVLGVGGSDLCRDKGLEG